LTTIIHGGEIAVKQIRGTIMSTISFCLACGMFSSFSQKIDLEIFADMDPNRLVGWLTLLYVGIGGLFGYFLTYESPVYLIHKQCDNEAKRVMMKLQNDTLETHDLMHDFKELKLMVAEDKQLSSSILKEGNIRPLFVVMLVRIMGVLAFNYPLNRVRLSLMASTFSLYQAQYALSCTKFIAGLLTLFTIDLIGRRTIFKLSSIGSCVSLFGLLLALVFKFNGLLVIIVVLLYDIFSGLGIGQLTDIYSSEAFPTSKKTDSLISIIIVENLLQILLTLAFFKFGYTTEEISVGLATVIIFAFLMVSIFCIVILCPLLPETNQLSIRQTRDLFRNRKDLSLQDDDAAGIAKKKAKKAKVLQLRKKFI
jgi:hypothetical protein